MRGLLVACIVVAITTTALADQTKPWSQGVPEAEQTLALEIYRQGNDEFVQSRYSQALVKYRQALVHWDHPAIRYNMAICLIEMHVPLEAYEHLEAALKYGAAPFDAEKYEKGVQLRKDLLTQLAQLDVTCSTEKARVTLDGQPLLECPGTVHRVIGQGRHEIVGRLEGHVPFTENFVAVAGSTTKTEVTFAPLESTKPVPPPEAPPAAPGRKRDWSSIIVIAGGVAIGATAVVYDFAAVQPLRDRLQVSSTEYDNNIDSFRSRRNFDIGLFAAAAVTVGVGVVLRVRRNRNVVITPSSGPGTAMVSVQW